MNRIVMSAIGALFMFVAIPKPAPAFSHTTPMQQSEQKNKTFSGTILKNGDKYILSDSANKISFVLDDAEKASPYEGKKVVVTGTIDMATNTLHVQTIQEVA